MCINYNKPLNILFISKKYSQWFVYLIALSFSFGTSDDENLPLIIFFLLLLRR